MMTTRYRWRMWFWVVTLAVWLAMDAGYIPVPSWYGYMLEDPMRLFFYAWAVWAIASNRAEDALLRGVTGNLTTMHRLTIEDNERRVAKLTRNEVAR